MIIKNETRLRELLNLKYVSLEELKNVTIRIYTDIEYAIKSSEDEHFIEFALHKLNILKECIDETDELSRGRIDEIHYDNYLCRNAELLLNEMQEQRFKIKTLGVIFNKYIDESKNIYSKMIYLRYLLTCSEKLGQQFSEQEIIKIIKICSEIYAIEPENVLCKKLIEELTLLMKKRLGKELENIAKAKMSNNSYISDIQNRIDRERYN